MTNEDVNKDILNEKYKQLIKTQDEYVQLLKKAIQKTIIPQCEIKVGNLMSLDEFKGMIALIPMLEDQDFTYTQQAMEKLFPFSKTGTYKKTFIGVKSLLPVEIQQKKRGGK